MQLHALRQFSKQILNGKKGTCGLLCALLLAVWLLFQLIRALTAAICSHAFPVPESAACLIWLVFLSCFQLVQMAATVPLQYQLLQYCTTLAGLTPKTAYSLRRAYCLQLIIYWIRTLLFLPTPVLWALGYRALQTAVLQPTNSTLLIFAALQCFCAGFAVLCFALWYSLALGAAPFVLIQHPELSLYRIPCVAIRTMRGQLRRLILIGGTGIFRSLMIWMIPRIVVEYTLCYNIPIAAASHHGNASS